MRINIYYGGRGLIEDPTIYVINKIAEVLEDIRVNVVKYKLFERKNEIAILANTLKEADAVILAVNVEWFGIGGLMQQFLDDCWLYADKESIKKIYMMPVVISNNFGEKEAEMHLLKAWEMLGGIPCEGIRAYVKDHVEFEVTPEYTTYIEKKAEAFYRTVNQKSRMLPSSTNAVTQNLMSAKPIELTPQESEQLTKYVSDEKFVKKQKEDVEELAQMFKGLLEKGEGNQEYIKNFTSNFKPQDPDFIVSYVINISDMNKSLVIEINGNNIKCDYGEKPDADVVATTTREILNKIVRGRTTFQGAFMAGNLSAKGNFKMLRTFDQVFQFNII